MIGYSDDYMGDYEFQCEGAIFFCF